MDDTQFWSIIETTKSTNGEVQCSELKTALSALSVDELIGFDKAYRDTLARAYHWDLWGAAYLIGGGCSDDGFDYFCDWLIAQGKETFEDALQNPETLKGKMTVWDLPEFEEFRYVMGDVMTANHDGEFPPAPPRPSDPAGEEWDEDDLEHRFPILAEWVNQKAEPVQISDIPQEISKPSFWQRLFGKK